MTPDEFRSISEALRAIRAETSDTKTRLTAFELRQVAMDQRLMNIERHLTALQHKLDHDRVEQE